MERRGEKEEGGRGGGSSIFGGNYSEALSQLSYLDSEQLRSLKSCMKSPSCETHQLKAREQPGITDNFLENQMSFQTLELSENAWPVFLVLSCRIQNQKQVRWLWQEKLWLFSLLSGVHLGICAWVPEGCVRQVSLGKKTHTECEWRHPAVSFLY